MTYIDIVRKLLVIDKNTIQPVDSKIANLKWYFYINDRDDLLIMLINEEMIEELFLYKLI